MHLAAARLLKLRDALRRISFSETEPHAAALATEALAEDALLAGGRRIDQPQDDQQAGEEAAEVIARKMAARP